MEYTQSPTPAQVGGQIQDKAQAEQQTMSFPMAIQKVMEGKKIHKLEWKDKEYYGFLNGGLLSLHKPDGKNYQWILNDGDLLGNDYIIL